MTRSIAFLVIAICLLSVSQADSRTKRPCALVCFPPQELNSKKCICEDPFQSKVYKKRKRSYQ